MENETPQNGSTFLAFLRDLGRRGITYSESPRYSIRPSRPLIHATKSDGPLYYGLRDDRLVSIKEVPSGLAADCLCPECYQPLVAKKGDKNDHHFAHHDTTSRSPQTKMSNLTPCAGGLETVVHRMAKQLIQERRLLVLPPVFVQCEYQWGDHVLVESEQSSQTSIQVSLRDVELESRIGNITPDILATLDSVNGLRGEKIIIEIAVTHFCDETKKNLIREMGLRCIEIDLSGFPFNPKASVDDVDDFRDHLWRYLTDPDRVTWIYSPRIPEMGYRVATKLQTEIKKREQEEERKKEEVARTIRSQEEIRKQEEIEKEIRLREWARVQEEKRIQEETEKAMRIQVEKENLAQITRSFQAYVKRHRDQWCTPEINDAFAPTQQLDVTIKMCQHLGLIHNQSGDWAFSRPPEIWQPLLVLEALERFAFSIPPFSPEAASNVLQKRGIVITTNLNGYAPGQEIRMKDKDWVNHVTVIRQFLHNCPLFHKTGFGYLWRQSVDYNIDIYRQVSPILWSRLNVRRKNTDLLGVEDAHRMLYRFVRSINGHHGDGTIDCVFNEICAHARDTRQSLYESTVDVIEETKRILSVETGDDFSEVTKKLYTNGRHNMQAIAIIISENQQTREINKQDSDDSDNNAESDIFWSAPGN